MTPKDSKRPFHTASDAEIKRGEVYDVYFERTVQILKARGDRKRVKAEVYLKALPEDWEWGVLAGIEEAAALLEGVPVDVRAMDEGTVFAPYQPVMELAGVYVDWAQYETALLGVLCQVQPDGRVNEVRNALVGFGSLDTECSMQVCIQIDGCPSRRAHAANITL